MDELKAFIGDVKGKTLLFLLDIIRMLIEVFQSGGFTDGDDAVKDGEKVLREMTRSEKAMFSVLKTCRLIKKDKEKEVEILLTGDNIQVEEEERCDCPICLFMPMMIGIEIQNEKQYFPKDPQHPDWLKILELRKEIANLQSQIKVLEDIFWESVKTGISEEDLVIYSSVAIRSGFQVVLHD